MLINPHTPPFDNPELRRAMVLSLDRKAFVDIITDGEGHIGATMLPPPEGVWGMPPDMLATLPGYGPDVAKNRAEARKIMEKLGYGPGNRLATKISTRNFPSWRDPAVLLSSQLKEIYIDAELDIVDTTQWYPKIMRKEFTVGAVPMETGVDDPDQMFYENFYLRRSAQLRRLQQSRVRQIGRPAVDAGRPRKTQEDRLAARAHPGASGDPAGASSTRPARPAASPGSRG